MVRVRGSIGQRSFGAEILRIDAADNKVLVRADNGRRQLVRRTRIIQDRTPTAGGLPPLTVRSTTARPEAVPPLPKLVAVRDTKYMALLRLEPCVFCGASAPSEVSHHGTHGVSSKASDLDALPACTGCHERWHGRGSPHETWDGMSRTDKRERFAELACQMRARLGVDGGEK